MPSTIKFSEDKAADVLKAEILYKGRFGAAQARAIVPLAQLRPLAARIAAGQGNPAAVAGACAGLGQRLALDLIRNTARATPGLAAAKLATAARRKKRVLGLVALALAGSLAAYGGWKGLRAVFRKKRERQAAALRAKGMAADDVTRRLAQAEQADDADFDAAATIVERKTEGDTADEGADESSGFSFKRLFRRGKGRPSAAARIEAARRRKAAAAENAEAAAAEADAAAAEAANKGGGDKGDDEEAPADAAGCRAPHFRRRRARFRPPGVAGLNPLARAALTTAVPGAGPALMVAQATKGRHPALSQSAVRLARARGGDPKAVRQIAAVNALAKKGHPGAQKEMKRLRVANALARRVPAGAGAAGRSLFERGVT